MITKKPNPSIQVKNNHIQSKHFTSKNLLSSIYQSNYSKSIIPELQIYPLKQYNSYIQYIIRVKPLSFDNINHLTSKSKAQGVINPWSLISPIQH